MIWRTSTYSFSNGNCIEVAADGIVSVRDTKDRDGATLTFTPDVWLTFLQQL